MAASTQTSDVGPGRWGEVPVAALLAEHGAQVATRAKCYRGRRRPCRAFDIVVPSTIVAAHRYSVDSGLADSAGAPCAACRCSAFAPPAVVHGASGGPTSPAGGAAVEAASDWAGTGGSVEVPSWDGVIRVRPRGAWAFLALQHLAASGCAGRRRLARAVRRVLWAARRSARCDSGAGAPRPVAREPCLCSCHFVGGDGDGDGASAALPRHNLRLFLSERKRRRKRRRERLLLSIESDGIVAPEAGGWGGRLIRLVNRRAALITANAYVSTLGGGHFLCKHVADARRLALAQMRIAEEMEDPGLAARCRLNLAYNDIQAGDFDSAAVQIEQLAKESQELEDEEFTLMIAAARQYLARTRRLVLRAEGGGPDGSGTASHSELVFAEPEPEDAHVDDYYRQRLAPAAFVRASQVVPATGEAVIRKEALAGAGGAGGPLQPVSTGDETSSIGPPGVRTERAPYPAHTVHHTPSPPEIEGWVMKLRKTDDAAVGESDDSDDG